MSYLEPHYKINIKKSREGCNRTVACLQRSELFSVPSSYPTSTPPEFSVFIPYCRASDQNPRLWLASIWLTGLIWLTPWLTWLRVTKILVYDWPIWRAFQASAGDRPGFEKSRNLPITTLILSKLNSNHQHWFGLWFSWNLHKISVYVANMYWDNRKIRWNDIDTNFS